jgi:RNA polymerase sigma factor (sigma-70 family)
MQNASAARGKAAGMLTLRELKNMAETAPSGQKTPTARELRSSGELIAERKIGESAGIAACRNGYAVYHAGRDATVFRIHAYSGYCYDSGSRPCSIGGRMFDTEAWYLRLVLEGEDRLFRNLASREQGWSVSYSAASEEWGGLYSRYSGAESALGGIIRAETVESLLSVLTERQRRAAVLFYLEQKTERQIAEELGITVSAVSRIPAKSLARMRAGIRRDTAPTGSGTA